MRSILTLVIVSTLIVFTSIYCIGQELVIQGKKWTYLIAGDINNSEPYNDRCLQIEGDTLISSIHYSTLTDYFSCDEKNRKINGFIRETTDSLVFYRPWYSDTEFLLYDFGIKVGDSIFTIVPSRCDSIGTTNKGQRIFYFTGAYNFKDNWIEGVGSEMGLLMEVLIGEQLIFTCCVLNNTELYHNPDFPNCIYTSNKEVNNDQTIRLIPIQNGEIRVHIQPESNGDLVIYTLDGKVILKKTITQSETTIHTPLRGLLLYRFICENGHIQTGKLMVK
jgi:hypothetical protein